MKKILLFIVVMVGFTMSAAYQDSMSDSGKSVEMKRFRRILPDSIYTMIENRPVLFYFYGHHGYSWCVITRCGNRYSIYRGRVNEGRDEHLAEPLIFNHSDSVTFFSEHEALLSWGFDSLPVEVSKMKPVKSESLFLGYWESLELVDSCGKCIFDSDNTRSFSGPDSVNFNKKFHRLAFTMTWLSAPIFQENITLQDLIKSYHNH